MVTIYVQNKPIYLVNSVGKEVEDYLHRPTTLFLDELNPAAVRTMLQEMEDPRFYHGVFQHADLSALLNAFKAELNVIQAAGGLVYTPQNDLLLIHRLGRWDLPKGKLDEGETLEECALREIGEETGASLLSMEKPLAVTYHTYHQKGKNNLKESHWYLVKSGEKTPLSPQTEEQIAECIWVSLEAIAPYIDGAFPSIADVLKRGVEVLRSK